MCSALIRELSWGTLVGRLTKELSWGRGLRTQKNPPAEADGLMRLKVGCADAHAEHGQKQYGQNLVAFHNGRTKNKCHAERKDAYQKHDKAD
jgi:hypothetical protein